MCEISLHFLLFFYTLLVEFRRKDKRSATVQQKNYWEMTTFLKVFCRVSLMQVASQWHSRPTPTPARPTSEPPYGPAEVPKGSRADNPKILQSLRSVAEQPDAGFCHAFGQSVERNFIVFCLHSLFHNPRIELLYEACLSTCSADTLGGSRAYSNICPDFQSKEFCI